MSNPVPTLADVISVLEDENADLRALNRDLMRRIGEVLIWCEQQDKYTRGESPTTRAIRACIEKHNNKENGMTEAAPYPIPDETKQYPEGDISVVVVIDELHAPHPGALIQGLTVKFEGEPDPRVKSFDPPKDQVAIYSGPNQKLIKWYLIDWTDPA